MFIVISGNFADGFRFHGPFDSFDLAAESDEASIPGSWIATLTFPNPKLE